MALIDDTYGMEVEVHTLISGESCVNVMRYYITEDPPVQDTPTDFLTEWLATVHPKWIDVISEDAVITQVRCSPTTPPGQGYTIYPPAFSFPLEAGDVVADSLPPQASYRMYKSPNVAAQSPATPVQEWRNGMIRIPGVPETFQEGGIVNGTGAFPLGILAAALPDIVVNTNVYTMYTKRVISGTPYYCPVDFCFAGAIIGSQNSRKVGS